MDLDAILKIVQSSSPGLLLIIIYIISRGMFNADKAVESLASIERTLKAIDHAQQEEFERVHDRLEKLEETVQHIDSEMKVGLVLAQRRRS
jgi:hypothetical protein